MLTKYAVSGLKEGRSKDPGIKAESIDSDLAMRTGLFSS